MNILISLGPGSWIVWLENDGEKNITNNNGVSFYSQKLSPSWLSFYQTVQDLKAQYPGAKVFTAHSGYGNGIIVSGFFRIVLCNPTNRNEGAKLMRQENGVWVEIVTDSNDVFDLLDS